MACGGSCSGGCGDGLGLVEGNGLRSPVRRPYLFARIDAATLATKGQQVNVPFDAIPLQDDLGRHAHIAGITLRATPQFDVVAASLPAAIPGYRLLSLFGNIFLEDVTGWQFMAGIDGRSIRDDYVMRNYKLLVADPADIPDADATNLQINMELYMPFTRNDEYGPTLRGAIPLAALIAKGRQALRFTASDALAGGNDVGLTYDGFQGTVYAIADLVYLPSLNYERWQLENYTIAETSGKLRHCDRWHEYAAVRYFPEDTGGTTIDDFTGVTVQANGQTLLSALNSGVVSSENIELVYQNRMWIVADPDADPTQFVDANGNATFVIMSGQMRKPVPGSPFGTISFNYSGRADHTLTRYLHRTIGKVDRNALGRIAAAACIKDRPVGRAIVDDLVAQVEQAPGAPTIVFGGHFATAGQAKVAQDVLI